MKRRTTGQGPQLQERVQELLRAISEQKSHRVRLYYFQDCAAADAQEDLCQDVDVLEDRARDLCRKNQCLMDWCLPGEKVSSRLIACAAFCAARLLVLLTCLRLSVT